MLEISRPIKESWLNFYEGYDDDIDGEYSTATEAVEKKGEKLVAKNATGRRMLKILNKKVNEYLISLETPLKYFPILIPTVILKKIYYIFFYFFFFLFKKKIKIKFFIFYQGLPISLRCFLTSPQVRLIFFINKAGYMTIQAMCKWAARTD